MADTAEDSPPTVCQPDALRVGRVYGEALLGLVADDAEAETVADELDALAAAVDQPGWRDYLADALRVPAEGVAFVERTFAARVRDELVSLLCVMASHGRLGRLRAVARAFRRALYRREGRVEVTVTASHELDEDHWNEIADGLSDELGAPVVLRRRVDEGLLGGLVVQVGDRMHDASLSGELRRLRRRLLRRSVSPAGEQAEETE